MRPSPDRAARQGGRLSEQNRTIPTGRGSAWLERLVRDQEVAGSNPVAPTKNPYFYRGFFVSSWKPFGGLESGNLLKFFPLRGSFGHFLQISHVAKVRSTEPLKLFDPPCVPLGSAPIAERLRVEVERRSVGKHRTIAAKENPRCHRTDLSCRSR